MINDTQIVNLTRQESDKLIIPNQILELNKNEIKSLVINIDKQDLPNSEILTLEASINDGSSVIYNNRSDYGLLISKK